jgi:hypothetical protein
MLNFHNYKDSFDSFGKDYTALSCIALNEIRLKISKALNIL